MEPLALLMQEQMSLLIFLTQIICTQLVPPITLFINLLLQLIVLLQVKSRYILVALAPTLAGQLPRLSSTQTLVLQ